MSDAIVLPTHYGFKDLTNRVFGKLTAISYAGLVPVGKKMAAAWLCRCECGTERPIPAGSLLSGNSSSCGCVRLEKLRVQSTKHGLSGTSENQIWREMKCRCSNPKRADYCGRGIAVCERWMTFDNFYADMGPRPSKKHSIDRIDNDKGYEPDNCRWATWSEQMRNTRANRLLELNGERKTVAEWVEVTGIVKNTIFKRLKLGWSDEKILTTAVDSRYRRVRKKKRPEQCSDSTKLAARPSQRPRVRCHSSSGSSRDSRLQPQHF